MRALHSCAKQLPSLVLSSQCRCSGPSARVATVCSAVDQLLGFTGKVHVVSDIHTDHPPNLLWTQRVQKSEAFREDVLILAGDVTHELGLLQQSLTCLVEAFKAVFFTVGNHELWTARQDLTVSRCVH